MYKIINNDSLLALEELEENSIDSIVTDPPYELNFMGKGWDNAGISFNKEIWQKCLRVLKPGGYLLAFGGSRTFHRIAVAIEDAGFEIRDTIMWLYGGGFPNTKSNGGKTTMPDLRDVGKKSKKAIGIDKLSFGQVSNVDRKESTYIAPCDSGSAARYFYCAKASKKDRDDGLEEFETKSHEEINNRKEGSAGATRQYGGGTNPFLSVSCPRKNTHPTVKPTELMQYLVRLVTPKGGTILDPFMGSGSTGKAVMFENKERNADYSFIGIEREKEYCDIAEARISFASKYEIPKEEKNQISFADLLDG